MLDLALLLADMASADSIAQGLADDSGLDFDFEDPARSWIDLVIAFKSGDPASVRACLTLAKASKWSHDIYNEDLMKHYSDEDIDGDGPEPNPFCGQCCGPCECGLVEL